MNREAGKRAAVGRYSLRRTVMSGYLFSVSRPDRYLWMMLDSSVW